MVKSLIELVKQKRPLGSKRSGQWRRVRAEFLKLNPACAACGSESKVEIHHIQSFHLRPDLELDPQNLIALCESKKKGVDCHRVFGHLSDYKRINPDVVKDAAYWLSKLKKE